MKNVLRLLFLALGLGLFAWFVREAGPAEIVRALKGIGWEKGALAMLPYLLVYGFDTLGWRFAFSSASAHLLPYFTQVRLRMAGEAVNNLIPSAYVGGEPVKIYLAKKRGVPTIAAAQSVVVAKTTMTIAQVFAIAIGALAATYSLDPGSWAHKGMLATTAIAACVAAALFWLQSRGMFTTVLRIVRALKIRIEKLEEAEPHLAELDEEIVSFYRNDKRRFFLSTLFHLCGWLSGMAEVMAISYLIGMPVHWTQAIAIEAFTGVAKGVGIFAPGSLGVQESGIALLFRVMGLPDALGISYAIIRRARELLFVAIGGAFLFSEEAGIRALADKARAETAEEG